jgi:hypothetical protein
MCLRFFHSQRTHSREYAMQSLEWTSGQCYWATGRPLVAARDEGKS